MLFRRRAKFTLVLLFFVCSCSSPAPDASVRRNTVGVDAYRANLWPQRPVVRLAFRVAPDLGSVTGTESVLFTPDRPTCELVFRAWTNNPATAAPGSRLTVTDSAVDDRPVAAQVEAAGAPAGAPGTLVRLPLPTCITPGESVRATLGFTVTLGANSDERVGHHIDSDTAWFGSAFPLLAWVRGHGWATEPAVPMSGETAVSEDFTLAELAVTAPDEFQVLGIGRAEGTAETEPGTTTHRFSAEAIRDVTVAVGQYAIIETDLDGIHLHLATPTAGTKITPQAWRAVFERAVPALTRRLGPFPYSDLWVSITPGASDGVAYPGALQLGDLDNELPDLVTHELAHQWFYGLVGANQAEYPWLDESLASYAEALTGTTADYRDADIPDAVTGRLGQPMSYWAEHGGWGAYHQGVSDQGAKILLRARERVGPDRFDATLRAYIMANAHRVATPEDFARAFATAPEVINALEEAGALPRR